MCDRNHQQWHIHFLSRVTLSNPPKTEKDNQCNSLSRSPCEFRHFVKQKRADNSKDEDTCRKKPQYFEHTVNYDHRAILGPHEAVHSATKKAPDKRLNYCPGSLRCNTFCMRSCRRPGISLLPALGCISFCF